MKIKVDGAAEGRRLREAFEGAGKRVEGEMEVRLKTEALKVESDATLLSPVDTGRLRASIGTRKVGKMHFEVGTTVDYARAVHDGTKHQRAQPFLTEALRKNQEGIREAMRKAVRAGMFR